MTATVAAAAAFAPAVTAVVITGDIAENGTQREYERARELLAPLTMPIHVIAGNHDDAEALAAAFGTETRWTARVGIAARRRLRHHGARHRRRRAGRRPSPRG